jgi:putative oxidoreductase
MKIIFVAARLLLGLIFLVVGLNGFHPFIPAPPPPDIALRWLMPMITSHYIWFTSGVQVITGIMLLTNRYVPLAIVTLAAVLANILAYHITMQIATIPLALVTLLLWFVVAWPYRAYFSPLFVSKVSPEIRA